MARSLNSTLRNSLLDGDSFVYAHLVKFERPKSSSSFSRKEAKDYLYLTDGSHDILFDDGSIDALNSANGTQTYIANKVKKVGAVSETTQARVTSVSLNISSTALSTAISSARLIVSGSSITSDTDLVEAGFREGDTIQLLTTSGSNNTARVRINSFSNSNLTAAVTALDKVVSGEVTRITSLTSEGSTPIASSGILYSLNFASPEVEGVITPATANRYAKYINRDVFIYKAHLNSETGAIIGAPYLLFKGIVQSGKVSEDPNKQSTVSWSLSSHWGDFSRVNGRVTSDSAHRALGNDGQPDVNALIRPEYAGDFGFQHSEQSINLVVNYNRREKAYRIKESGGWFFGLNKSYSQEEYYEMVKTETDLSFNLNAKTLPVVYGVNKIDSIPVFVDTAANSSSKVFVAYALCEGPISGILDIYQDDSTTICINSPDATGRGDLADGVADGLIPGSIDVPCTGRMDAGSVIKGYDVLNTSATPTVFGSHTNSFGQQSFSSNTGELNVHTEVSAFPLKSTFGQKLSTVGSANWTGLGSISGGISFTRDGTYYSTLFDKKGMHFETPIDLKLIFHSGKAFQDADSLLLFNSNNMKLGNDYHSGKPTEYWGAGHRLLDTAYVAGEFNISEGETTIPSLDFVVRGKAVNCFNYDFAYRQHPDYVSSNSLVPTGTENAQLEVRSTADNSLLDTARLADKYTITDIDGGSVEVMRFVDKLDLGNVTSFYVMISGQNNTKYYLRTFDDELTTNTVSTLLTEEITAASANSGNNGTNITKAGTSSNKVDAALSLGARFAIAPSHLNNDEKLLHTFSSYTYSSGNTINNVGQTASGASSLVGQDIIIKNAIALHSGATSSVVGSTIELTYNSYSDGSIRKMTREITAFDNTTKVALVDQDWDVIPLSGQSFKIFSDGGHDLRVTNNPAMQLLDYLTNERYGRGLDIDTDIDAESFFETARLCDTRSDVTILMDTNYNSTATQADFQDMIGTVYKCPGSTSTDGGSTFSDINVPRSKDKWYGRVKSVTPINIGGNTSRYFKVVFEDCIGKLTHRYHDWKGYRRGQLYYDTSGNLGIVAADATEEANPISAPSPAPSVVSSNFLLRLNKTTFGLAGGSGPNRIGVDTDKSRVTFEGNPVVKDINVDSSGNIISISNGYSLYDSDDVKYWRYCGWEEQHQRWVTRHQTNHVINTATSIFDNINGMLGHFNGILRYSNGKYALGLKAGSDSNSFNSVSTGNGSYVIEDINEDDIIGAINVSDPGTKGTNNSVTLSLVDPQNKFESRSITLLNSEYLKEDKRIPRKGDVRAPGVTNYQNARINAKQYLDQSRKSLKITFTMGPRGVLLHSGDLIRVTYPRFNFSSKMFRISNLSIEENCLIKITAEEHDDDSYLIRADLPISILQEDPTFANFPTPTAPTALSASQNARGGIDLTWSNTTQFNPAIFTVQIYRGVSNNRDANTTKLIGISKGSAFTDTITGEGQQTFYYWIRYQVLQPARTVDGIVPKEILSAYHPTSATGGVAGISDGAIDASNINLTNDNVTIRADQAGTVSSFANSGTTITVFIGATQLTYDNSGAHDVNNSFRVTSVSVVGVTADSSPNITSNSYALGNITAMPGDVGTITFSIAVRDSLGRTVTYDRIQTFTKSRDGLVGSNGEDGRVVSLSTSDQTIEYDTSGANPSPSSTTITATAFNTAGTVYFEFLKNNSAVQNSTSNTYTYVPASSRSSMPETITVKIREGSNLNPVLATDQISIAGLQDGAVGAAGRDAIVIILSNEAHTVPAASDGTVSSFTGSGTDIQVYQGTTQLTYDGSSPFSNSTFRVSGSGSNISPGSASTVSGNTRRFGVANSMTADSASITFTITVKGSDGVENIFTRVQSFSKSKSGGDGSPGATGPRTASGQLFYQVSSSSAPGTPTASNYNFSTGLFGSHTSNWAESAPTFQAGNSNKYWYARFTVTEASFGGTQTITFGSVLQGIGFSGLVTFQGTQLTDGSTTTNFGTSNFDGNYNNLSNLPTLFDGQYSNLSGRPNIPTNISDLVDDSSFVLPSEVAAAINSNTTTIDGAKITSGSIATGALATNVLVAGNISGDISTFVPFENATDIAFDSDDEQNKRCIQVTLPANTGGLSHRPLIMGQVTLAVPQGFVSTSSGTNDNAYILKVRRSSSNTGSPVLIIMSESPRVRNAHDINFTFVVLDTATTASRTYTITMSGNEAVETGTIEHTQGVVIGLR